MAAKDQEAQRLRALLTGKLDSAGRHELETRLAERPSLRRRLADMALAAELTQPAIRVQEGVVDEATTVDADLDVGPMLGRGGMAVVRLGRQLKLDRPVAIKALREGHVGDADVGRLLTEARITGRLEHPNIVPVHDIVRGEDGLPQVVLKLIEGHTWSDLMADAARVQELFAADDLLEWNLEVIMAVARALSFAHSRRVLHRDVKPSNVMVGPFGEVYLWTGGSRSISTTPRRIATSLRGRARTWRPSSWATSSRDSGRGPTPTCSARRCTACSVGRRPMKVISRIGS